ncbi:hypothetical protein [Aquibacillus albus]|uniref:Uncharacterized protein n=1 Tax=Aquibacillus albus TaxID=1168171 RepID=A0ABS2N5Z3_9BACI|nr:hypothetical protein [Aquibacillus albus]MBM7573564.1 hypothetical protein [Aquibacillus albus]
MSKKGNVISFNDYKRKKYGLDRPIFSEPVKISIGDPKDPEKKTTFVVVCNFVHDDRQFLALDPVDKEEELYTIVEGVVDRGSLVKVVPIAEHEYPEIEAKFSKIFAQVNTKYEDDNRRSFGLKR